MGIFGWSYPPGCSGPPDDEEPCKICGEWPDNCICPECPECGEYGDPDCYRNHGLIKTEEQKFNLEVCQRQWQEDGQALAADELLMADLEELYGDWAR